MDSFGPHMKEFIVSLAGRAEVNLGHCGNFVDSLGKIVNPTYISELGYRDSILMAIFTKSKMAIQYFSKTSGARPLYS